MKQGRKYFLLFVFLASSSLSFSAKNGNIIFNPLECPTAASVQGLRGPERQVVNVVFVTQGQGTLECDKPQIPLTRLLNVSHFVSIGSGGPIQCVYIGESSSGLSICDLRLKDVFVPLRGDVPLGNFIPNRWVGGQCVDSSPAVCPFARLF
jgi:hypothetical protein